MSNVNVGTDADVTFTTASVTFVGNLTNISMGDAAIPEVNTSHMQSSNVTYVSGDLEDFGTVTVAGFLDVDEPYFEAAAGLLGSGKGTLTVTFPIFTSTNSTAAKVTGSAFPTGWSAEVPLEDAMTQEVTFRWDGVTGPTWSDEAV